MDIDGDRVAAVFEDLWRQMATRATESYWRRVQYGLVAFVSEVPSPAFNGVFVSRHDVDPTEVRALLEAVSETNFPFCLQARPALRSALAGIADDMGMVTDDDVPLMVLDDPTALRAATHVQGLEVRLLTEGEHSVHEDLLAAGFEIPREMAHAFMQFTGRPQALREFVGEVAGRPVTLAATLPSVDASVAVFDVVTPPEQRRNGYGAAVTASAVLDGLDNGATFACLQSSVVGYPVYQRLGFRTVESWPVWVTASDHSHDSPPVISPATP